MSKKIHGKYFPVVFLCTYQLPLHSALDCGNYHGLSNGNLERLAEPTRSRHAMSRHQTGLPIHGIRARRVESFTRSALWVFGWPSAVPARLAVDCVPYSRPSSSSRSRMSSCEILVPVHPLQVDSGTRSMHRRCPSGVSSHAGLTGRGSASARHRFRTDETFGPLTQQCTDRITPVSRPEDRMSETRWSCNFRHRRCAVRGG